MATDNSQLIEQRLPDNLQELIAPADVRAVAHALDNQVPNQRRGGPFFVTFLTQAQAIADGRVGDGSLESLDAGLLCLGARARVELHPDGNGIEMVLVFDGTGQGPQVAVNGNFKRTIAGKWVKADSPAAVNANVPYYDPQFNAPTGYPVAYLVRYQVVGQAEAFYYSRKAGQLPAPTGAAGDPNWRVVPGPVAATVLSQHITLQEAQGLEGASVVEGRLYAITGAPTAGVPNPHDNCWNQDGATTTVYVRGLENYFERRGILLDGNGIPTAEVTVNVAAGTYAPLAAAAGGAAPWAAGQQAASSLVYNDGAVWRVKADIANSQTGPTKAAPNAQYYEYVGGADLLGLLTTVPQHTQAIADLLTRGGRFRGEGYYATFYGQPVKYLANDFIKYNGTLVYALQDLPTPPAAYDPSQWASLLGALGGRLQVVSPTGATSYYSTWPDAHSAAPDGSTITLYAGTYGATNQVAVIQKNLDVRVLPGAIWNFSYLYLHSVATTTVRKITISGAGTLNGTIFWYGNNQLDITLSTVRHNGNIVHNAYPANGQDAQSALGNTLVLDNVRGTASTGDYLTAYTRYGGYYDKPLKVEVRLGRFVVTNGAFYNYTGTANTADKANNLLKLLATHIECAAGQSLIVIPDDVVTFDFARTSYTGTLAANVSSAVGYGFLGMPAGGSGAAAGSPFNPTTTGDGTKYLNDKGQYSTPAGGTASSTTATASGIDYANPVTLDAATTLQVNKAYYVTGASYKLTLPDASQNVGAGIFLEIAAAATGLFAVGPDGLAMYARETMLLRATQGGWAKAAPGLRPLSARLETALGQQGPLSGGAYSTIPLSSVITAPAIPAMVEDSTRLVVQRAAKFALSAGVSLKNCTQSGEYWIYIRVSPPDQNPYFVTRSIMATVASDSTICATSVTAIKDLAVGTRLDVQVYCGPSANLRGTYPGNECFLDVTEIV